MFVCRWTCISSQWRTRLKDRSAAVCLWGETRMGLSRRWNRARANRRRWEGKNSQICIIFCKKICFRLKPHVEYYDSLIEIYYHDDLSLLGTFFFPFPRVCVMYRTCLWRCLRTGPSWKSTLWTRSGRTPGSGRRTWTKRSTIRTTAARWTSTRITSWTACTNHDSAHRPTHQRTNRSPPSHQTPHFSLVMLHLIPSTPLSRQQAQTPFFLHGLMDHSNVQFFSITVVLNQVLDFSFFKVYQNREKTFCIDIEGLCSGGKNLWKLQ